MGPGEPLRDRQRGRMIPMYATAAMKECPDLHRWACPDLLWLAEEKERARMWTQSMN